MKNLSEKTCTKCQTDYPATAEYFYRKRECKCGLREECKGCSRQRGKAYRQTDKGKQRQKKYSKTEKGRIVNKRCYIKYEYGITLEEYNKLLASQENCCIICGRHSSEFKKELALDHDHETGKIRGFLCFPCNAKLGWFEKYKNKVEGYLNDTVVPV